MSWTAPMTAVSNTAFTAAQFNTYVRDNLMETAPALASASGQTFVSDGVNSIAVRVPTGATVTTAQTTTSSTYGNLSQSGATVGPVVTVATGTKAIVAITAGISNSADNAASAASYAVSGATTIAASVAWRVVQDGAPAGNTERYTAMSMQNNLNPGNNTFTMQYLVGSGTGTFEYRELIVIPF